MAFYFVPLQAKSSTLVQPQHSLIPTDGTSRPLVFYFLFCIIIGRRWHTNSSWILQLVEAHWGLMHPGWPKLLCSGGNHTHYKMFISAVAKCLLTFATYTHTLTNIQKYRYFQQPCILDITTVPKTHLHTRPIAQVFATLQKKDLLL